MAYTGVSIVDYLSSVGQATDYASRSQLAASKGITGYTGSAQQNTQLLGLLRGGEPVAPSPTNTVSQPQPSYSAPQPVSSPTMQPSSLSQPSQTGGFNDAYLRSKGYNDPNVISSILSNPGSYSIYQDFQRETMGPSTSGFLNAPTINLPEIYEGLYSKSGIKDIENDLSSKSKAYTDQVSKIRDNPYLSEGTMSGRLDKLKDQFNADTANLRDDIAMRKADIETRIGLQTKQFDINSQQAQLALSQFNSLLQSGALDSASGEDIANITRSTGLSSSMIQSMITFQKKKNAPKLDLQQFDDGTNQYIVAFDPEGNVVNKQVVGSSKTVATKSSGITPYQSAQQDTAKQNAFEKAISDGISQLEKGRPWGEVWDRIHALYPDVPPELIDVLLGTSWREAGAYERS